MGSAIIRALRIIALTVWLITSLLGILIFNNLTRVKWDFPTEQQSYGDTWISFNVTLRYDGYVFDISFTLKISLLDANNDTLAHDEKHVILEPGDHLVLPFNITVSDIRDVKWKKVSIIIYQIIGNVKIIGIDLETQQPAWEG